MSSFDLNIENLRALNADFGGKRRYAHPKMLCYTQYDKKKYYVYVLNLEKSLEKLKKLKNVLKEIDQEGKKILFVATKEVAKGLLEKFITKTNHFFIDKRWLGGVLTNFDSIQKQIFLLQEMYARENKGLINLLTKKERVFFQKKKINLENNLKGILEMSKIPDYLFIIDPQCEKIALKEAQKLQIPVLALVKTNVNPEKFEHFVPINDGSREVLELIMKNITENCLQSKNNFKKIINKEVAETKTK